MTTVRPEQMSPVTRQLFEYERQFLIDSSKDLSFRGQMKTNLVGRVLTLAVSLILHAEAVCRAVIICFMTIQDIFSKSNEELLKQLKGECSTAYVWSFRSFFATFFPKSLSNLKVEERMGAVPPPAEERARPAVMALPNFDAYPGASLSARHAILQDHFLRATPQDDLVVVENSDAASRSTTPKQPLGSDLVHVSLRQDPNTAERADSESGSDAVHLRSGVVTHSPAHESESADEDAMSVFSLPAAHPVPVIDGVLTDQEKMLIQLAEERLAIRLKHSQAAAQLKEEPEVRASLAQNLRDAQAKVRLPLVELKYHRGEEWQYQDKDKNWEVAGNSIGGMQIGTCRFSNDPHSLKADPLTTTFTVFMANKNYPISLFGLFDPQVGIRAAAHLAESLPGVLSRQLREHNQKAVSQAGIVNAITQAFLELNKDFLQKQYKLNELLEKVADNGTSATIALIVEDQLYTASVGNTRAALANGGVVQLTEDPNPQDPKYQAKMNELRATAKERALMNGMLHMATGFGFDFMKGMVSPAPFITCHGKLDHANTHLFIGTQGIFQLNSTINIGNLLKAKQSLPAKDLAHDCIQSILKSAPQGPQRSLSCLVVKFNPEDFEGI